VVCRSNLPCNHWCVGAVTSKLQATPGLIDSTVTMIIQLITLESPFSMCKNDSSPGSIESLTNYELPLPMDIFSRACTIMHCLHSKITEIIITCRVHCNVTLHDFSMVFKVDMISQSSTSYSTATLALQGCTSFPK
jgi:hypothetical protein